MPFNWQSLGLELIAMFQLPDGQFVRLPVSSFQGDFALNEIPTARLEVVPGRNARDLRELSAVHQALQQTRLLTPASVYLRVKEKARSELIAPVGTSWPAGWLRIFDGNAVGLGEARQLGRAGVQIVLTHWLADLAFSSAVSRSSSPSNPADYSFGAVYRATRTGAGDWVALADPLLFSALNLTADFWKESLLVWFRRLCAQDRLVARPFINPMPPGSKNELALQALERFEGGSQRPYRFAGPLAMDIKDIPASVLIQNIRSCIIPENAMTLAGTTLWDKLAGEVCPLFALAIAPAMDRAMLVPFTPGLASSWTTIRASDYHALRRQVQLPRPLRGVGILAGIGSLAGGAYGPQGIGGYYEPVEPAYKNGMVLLREAPPWLRSLCAATFLSRDSAAPAGTRSGAAAPAAGPPLSPAAVELTSAFLYSSAQTLWNSYAQYVYASQILSGRQLILSGRLRLDIAPGSTVIVESREDPFVEERLLEDGLAAGSTSTASVLRVSLIIDHRGKRAETLLHLGHVREASETGSPLTLERNPLWRSPTVNNPAHWKGYFPGAPLLDYPEFDRRGD